MIKNYVDSQNQVLSAAGPSRRLVMTDDFKKNFMSMLNVDVVQYRTVRSEAKSASFHWSVFDVPMKIPNILAIRYFLNKKDEKSVKMVAVMSTLIDYVSQHSHFFPYVSQNTDKIMEYVVGTLSERFLLKQEGSLLGALVRLTESWLNKYRKAIMDGTDKGIFDAVTSLYQRIKEFLKEITDKFMEAHKSGNYLNAVQDNQDEDNFFEADNVSFAIRRVADKVAFKLSTTPTNNQLVQLAAKMSSVSVSAMRNATMKLVNEDPTLINELTTLIVSNFLSNSSNNVSHIRSNKFIYHCKKMFQQSNTKEAGILRIKEIVDGLLEKYSVDYVKTERVATKVNFRNAMFLYFVFMIQDCMK